MARWSEAQVWIRPRSPLSSNTHERLRMQARREAQSRAASRKGAASKNMITLLTVFHVIVCIFLILVVLLQQGKGADWAGAFGGGGTQTAFGARGAGTILSKATTT